LGPIAAEREYAAFRTLLYALSTERVDDRLLYPNRREFF